MAGLDELFNQIPTEQIASRLGVDEAEVNTAIHTLLPVLVGGLQQNAQDPDTATNIASAANNHAASDILGSILGGGASGGGGDNPLGSILGSVLGGNKSGGLGDILGGKK